MPKFVENKFWNWVITGIILLCVSGLIGAGTIGTDMYYKVKDNSEKIGNKANKSDLKGVEDRATNVESMARSNDNAIDIVKTDVAVIKVEMATQEDLNDMEWRIINEIQKLR